MYFCLSNVGSVFVLILATTSIAGVDARVGGRREDDAIQKDISDITNGADLSLNRGDLIDKEDISDITGADLSLNRGDLIDKLKLLRPGDDCPSIIAPVCADGITMQNECLALLQGADKETISSDPCEGDDKSVEAFDEGRAFSEDDMYRFSEEGFILVGRVRNSNVGPKIETRITDKKEPAPDQIKSGQRKKLTRVTADGLLYKTRHFKPKEKSDSDFKKEERLSEKRDPPNQQKELMIWPSRNYAGDKVGDNDGKRKLSIIGADTRIKISSSFTWPHWRLGEIDWSYYNEGGCSGTIIGNNKVLTAAHCVYDAPSRNWMVPDYFAPGRYRSSSGTTVEPWGRWPVQYATIYSAWTHTGSYSFGDVKYDVAVLTMGTNWAGNIGYMGTLPVISAPCFIDPGSRSTGYPGDKPDGEMWTTGTCSLWLHWCGSNIAYHTCDTAGGQSGSAMYDDHERVFGVHTAGGTGINAGFSFDSSARNDVLSW